MGKSRSFQLEMFSLDKNGKDNPSSSSFNVKYIKNSEKIILSAFLFLLMTIISYCFGFRQGKKVALLINNNIKQINPVVEDKTIPSSLEKKVELPLQDKIKEQPKSKPHYTIQVATYKTSDYAHKEAERLKKNGFSTMIINKGNYILLCVGSFFNKQEAEIVLAKLKKNYADSFIRRF